MTRSLRERAAAFALALVLVLGCGILAPVRASAARPLLDQHQWDAYFAMFARDSNVPWQPATIRLDTYSGAPVDFAVYNVDPAAVIVAGQNRPARALDTSHMKPLNRWRFQPPSGYRFVSSDVAVPLGAQEGFYVVEARRGDAVQQVWLNRTHIGLVTEESPQGLVLWGADLRTGRAIGGMHVDFLVGLALVSRTTSADGTIVWNEAQRPVFALAEHNAGRAFVSLLPSAPLPPALVSVRLAESVARAGGRIRAVGFARRLGPGGYRRGGGPAKLSVIGGGRTIVQTVARLDGAGSFDAELPVPENVPAGSYTVLVNAAGGVSGTSVQIDAAANVAIAVGALCPCDAARPVTVVFATTRGGSVAAAAPGVPGPAPQAAAAPGIPIRLEIVRIPHVLPPGAAADAPRWGTTVVATRSLTTDGAGLARYTLEPPADGLDSTYAVRATTAGATATTRVVVPAASVALALEPDATEADPGSPVGFTVRAFRVADGAPVPGLSVTVKLTHGSTRREATVTLDAAGSRRVTIAGASLGNNLAIASAQSADGRTILDAASVDVAPRVLTGASGPTDADLTIALDRARYGPHDRAGIRANAPGASGDALLAIAGARTYAMRVTSAAGGRAQATLDLGDAQGDVRVRAAFVRGGAIATVDVPLHVDGPGRERTTDLSLDRAIYAAGSVLHATIRDGAIATGAPATIAVRISDGRPEGSAYFGDAPDVLLTGGTSAQAPASDNVSWHAWTAPARSKASDLFGADRGRSVTADLPNLGAATPHTFAWQIQRQAGESLDVDVPRLRGHYVLSVLKMQASGEVGAASTSFEVE